MAKITHIDIIKGFSSKLGGGKSKRTSATTTFTWLRESTPYT